MLGAGGKSKGTAGAAGSIGGAPAKGMLGGIGAPWKKNQIRLHTGMIHSIFCSEVQACWHRCRPQIIAFTFTLYFGEGRLLQCNTTNLKTKLND